MQLTRDQANQYLANSDWMVSTLYVVYVMLTFFVHLQSLLVKDQLTQEILHGKDNFFDQQISLDADSFSLSLSLSLFSRECISGLF